MDTTMIHGMAVTMNEVADATIDCKVCNSGEYYDANKGTVCKDCPAGTVRAVNGHDNDPWDGTAMNEVADATIDCKVCNSGKYQHEDKKTVCINCPVGTVRYQDGDDGDPWLGTAMNQVANTKADCKVCLSGKYQEEQGQTSCKNCGTGARRYQ